MPFAISLRPIAFYNSLLRSVVFLMCDAPAAFATIYFETFFVLDDGGALLLRRVLRTPLSAARRVPQVRGNGHCIVACLGWLVEIASCRPSNSLLSVVGKLVVDLVISFSEKKSRFASLLSILAIVCDIRPSVCR